MKVYTDKDADPSSLKGKQIAVLGYGNQGRAQALNLRDSGLDVIVGNRDDDYLQQAREDKFEVFSILEAASAGDVLLLLPRETRRKSLQGIPAASRCPSQDTGKRGSISIQQKTETGNIPAYPTVFSPGMPPLVPPDW